MSKIRLEKSTESETDQIVLEYPVFGGMHSIPMPVKALAWTGSRRDFGKSLRSV